MKIEITTEKHREIENKRGGGNKCGKTVINVAT